VYNYFYVKLKPHSDLSTVTISTYFGAALHGVQDKLWEWWL